MKTTAKPEYNERYYVPTAAIGISAMVGAIVAFVFALYYGAFASKDHAGLVSWIAVIVAACSAGISGMSAYLLAGTLKATVGMLNEAEKSRESARKSALHQMRPWVLVDNVNVTHNYEAECINVTFKNFGSTPAKDVILTVQLGLLNGAMLDSKEETPFVKKHFAPSSVNLTYLTPNRPFNIQTVGVNENDDDSNHYQLNITWSYIDVHAERRISEVETYWVMKKGGSLALIDYSTPDQQIGKYPR